MSPLLLKKPSSDRNLLKNYRLVSNLSFRFKLIEKAVAKQLNSYIETGSPMSTSPLTGDCILQKLYSLKSKTTLLLQWTQVKLLHSHCWTSQQHSTLLATTFFLTASGIGLVLIDTANNNRLRKPVKNLLV